MPIKSITYKRIKNLGNYESKTLEATSIVNESDDAARELEELIAFVENNLFPPQAVSPLVENSAFRPEAQSDEGDTPF
ncbi:hypothetical protein NIES4075_25180 [Tolypothrix sp. NIES-4075]|uniref:hypothetical protein n=1 Tax=Tolypothrix sp. NIES-4075 TaxID=2005459 RepID=UPI000B5CA058|nr:hypothetical protein [Tolypothrix sp. NIES-4075]GAX41545.1 hypothetical protein NIES4075_25180 [Tolypothrix sp. NIES-4075]